MAIPVTYLFVPGNRPERFAKALAAGADAVIVDLEDAVAPADKAAARAAIAQWLQTQASVDNLLVRINAAQSAWFADDLAWLKANRVAHVMLSKAEETADLTELASALPENGRILALIESAAGIANIDEIAQAAKLERIAFGTLDYAVDMNLSGDERGLIYPSTRIALASRLAGLLPPVAGVTPAIDDEVRLQADLAFERAMGFSAKLCIHPRQVALVQKALQPSAAEMDWAQRVVAAVATGDAVVQIDGRMVDRPVILKAESILARAPKE